MISTIMHCCLPSINVFPHLEKGSLALQMINVLRIEAAQRIHNRGSHLQDTAVGAVVHLQLQNENVET